MIFQVFRQTLTYLVKHSKTRRTTCCRVAPIRGVAVESFEQALGNFRFLRRGILSEMDDTLQMSLHDAHFVN